MKVLIASSLDADAIKLLEQEHQVTTAFRNVTEGMLRIMIRDCEVLVFRSGVQVNAELMDCAPNLKLLVRAGSGLDNLDLEYVQRRGLKLVRIAQTSARAVAEMAFALMLSLSRRLFEADRSMRESRWAKDELSGYMLHGKTLGIVGVGNTGGCVAELGVAWGMTVCGCIEHGSPERTRTFREKGVQLADLNQVVANADYLSIHVPLKENTRNIIDAEMLSRMKPGSYLVNLGRGGIVNELDLYQALTIPGGLCGAALDVHEHEGEGKLSPLAGAANVILTPHIGAMTVDAQREIGQRVLEIISSFAENNGYPATRERPSALLKLTDACTWSVNHDQKDNTVQKPVELR